MQSDVEMLSIQAMEAYEINNHITGEEAIKCLKLIRRERYE